MLGFVPQQVHRQRASEASTQDTDGEQGLLRDPPPPGFCCHLVIGIHAETDHVQQDENCCDESLHVGSPFFDAGRMPYYTRDLFCCGQIIDLPGEGLRVAPPKRSGGGRPNHRVDRRSDGCRPNAHYIQTSGQKKLVGVTDPRPARLELAAIFFAGRRSLQTVGYLGSTVDLDLPKPKPDQNDAVVLPVVDT
jgi:hypothetical protein